MIARKLADRYELVEELGEGGMGVVYRARDPLLERDVAIKMVPPARLSAKNEIRFRREARLVAQMDHRAIVPIHDLGTHDGSLFFVMPLLEGMTLRQRVEAGDLELLETVQIAVEVAEALAHSHARGVIHRDIKPENVMVSHDADEIRVRVMDFGLAWESNDDLSQTGMIGTPAYLSPEQLKGEELDDRTDLYSLGATIYECLAGTPPFDGPIHALIYRIGTDPPPPLQSHRGVDPALEAIVLACLAKSPTQRPRSALHLASQFKDYLRMMVDDAVDEVFSTSITDADRQQPRRAAAADFLPMVGHKDVWTTLGNHFDDALAGESQLVLLGGEAGMGKSRTLLELENLATSRGVLTLRGRYSGTEETFPYEGLCELIRDYFRPGGPWSAPGASDLATIDLGDLVPELLRLFPIFAEVGELRRAIRGIDPAARKIPRLLNETNSESDKTYVFELLARSLIRLGNGRPMVLLLENLHDAYASIEALRYIVHRLGPTPTLVVGSYRPAHVDRDHPLRRLIQGFGSDARKSFLILEPLTVAEVKRMAELVVGGTLTTSLGERLYQATEGNPFFVQELTRSLLESESIIFRDGKWQLSGDVKITSRSLPTTIHQVLEARLDRLPEEVRNLLTFAAVLGKKFEFADLEGLSGVDSDELDQAVDRLLAEGILREDRQSRGDHLYFASRLVRDLLYGDLPRRRRRMLHRRHAERLEARSVGHEERLYPLLVYHFSAGDVPDKTVTYALRHARRTLAAANTHSAIHAAKTALEFVDENEIDDSQRLTGEILEILARAHRALGEYGRAFHYAGRSAAAFNAAGAAELEAGVALLAAQTAWQGRQIEATRQWVDRGTQLAREAGVTIVLRRLLALGSTVSNLRGETRVASRYREEAESLEPVLEIESGPHEIVPQGGTLHVSLPMLIGKMDPAALESDEHGEVVLLVFEPLLDLDDEGHLVSSLCADWEDAEGGRLFHLTLRQGIRFADGHPLSAWDVKASFERLARMRTDSPVPALMTVAGRDAFLRGETDDIRGLEVARGDGTLRLTIRLTEPLPIYPTLLNDPHTAIVRAGNPSQPGVLVGTGPFRVADHNAGRVLLIKNPDFWRGTPPNLDLVEFLTSLASSEVVAGLRDGTMDLGRDLVSDDLEEALRDPVLSPRLVEATCKNVYFVLCNNSGPTSHRSEVRQALFSVVRTNDLVWRTLGRFAQPAAGLIPPGILGNDPGRRRAPLTAEAARELLESAGLTLPLRLHAVIHPVLLDRGMELIEALLAEWSAIGIEIDFEPRSMNAYLEAYRSVDEIDLLIGRWSADYDDPDTFTHSLFDSRHGLLRRYFQAAEADQLLERGRQETSAEVRQDCYQQFQDLLDREHALLPLFHDITYRIVGPKVRGLRLQSHRPYVNYESLGKREDVQLAVPQVSSSGGGELHVAVHSRLASLDPVRGNYSDHVEVVANVFECLTGLDEEARVVPRLAASFTALNGAQCFRFCLRDDVRFHDGRRLTARDVRHSFERLLLSPERGMQFLLLPIVGAEAFRQGEATGIEGLKIVSTHELLIELAEPAVFFPALLAHPGAAIVPEGVETLDGTWRENCVGTGPFRVARFEPEVLVELERNDNYWRLGIPKSERLSFHLGVAPKVMLEDFRGGRLSVASGLSPEDIATLRSDTNFAAGYREAPRLSTLFVVLNAHQGPLADRDLRRSLRDRLAVGALVRDTIGHQGTRARGLIPPGLLGYEELRGDAESADSQESTPEITRLNAAFLQVYEGQYAALGQHIRQRFEQLGLPLKIVATEPLDVEKRSRQGSVDVTFFRWVADCPDPDSFVTSLLHSQEGVVSGLLRSPEIDRLIYSGRRETDSALRHAIYRELEDVLEREALLIPLFHEQGCHFSHPTIEGLRISFSLPEIPYDELASRE